MSGRFLVRAPFFHTPANAFTTPAALVAEEDGGLHVENGRIVASGPYQRVAEQARDLPTLDWRGGYVLPGLVDTHVHYPQLRIIGALGCTLLDWLEQVALPEEARMADHAYAARTAEQFVDALASHGTTTAMVFGAHFAGATAALFEAARARGLRIASGLVLADRALRSELHVTPAQAHRESTSLIERFHGRDRLLYAVTPRFALSASEAMLEVCQTLLRAHDGLRVQTHINEQPDEVDGCVGAFPWARDYLSIYERYSLAGPHTVLAHNVQATDDEIGRIAGAGASIAHCPCSNAALGSGIFPLRRHLAAGARVALGTDVGGGTGFGMLKEALQAYLMQRVADDGYVLDAGQLLYLATRAGAEALGLSGETGDLSAGTSADFVCIRPAPGSPLAAVLERANSLQHVLAAIITLGDAGCVQETRVAGEVVYRRMEPQGSSAATAVSQ